MSRYERINACNRSIYMHASRVIVCAQAILKDNKTGGLIAQVKYQNISSNLISALFVDVFCYDVTGKLVEEIVDFQYLDLCVKRDEFFGSQIPIKLSNLTTRKIEINVKQVIYQNTEKWMCEGEDTIAIPNLEVLSSDVEIMNQAKIEFGSKAKYQYQDVDDLWLCTCGAVNHDSETRCHLCNVLKIKLEQTPVATIEAKMKERIAELNAAKRLAEEKQRAEELVKREKIEKSLRVILPIFLIFVIMVIAVVTKPSRVIAKAQRLSREGQYVQALIELRKLSQPEKTSDVYEEIRVLYEQQVQDLIDAGDLEKALEQIKCFEEYEYHDFLIAAVWNACPHEDVVVEERASTCTEGGYKKQLCEFCGYLQEEYYKVMEHEYIENVIKEATCSVDGEKVLTCGKCGDVVNESIVKIEHTYESVVTRNPSYTETGIETSTCVYCGDVKETVIAKLKEVLLEQLVGTWIHEADARCESVIYIKRDGTVRMELRMDTGSPIDYIYEGKLIYKGNNIYAATGTEYSVYWDEYRSWQQTLFIVDNYTGDSFQDTSATDYFYKRID